MSAHCPHCLLAATTNRIILFTAEPRRQIHVSRQSHQNNLEGVGLLAEMDTLLN